MLQENSSFLFRCTIAVLLFGFYLISIWFWNEFRSLVLIDLLHLLEERHSGNKKIKVLLL